MAYGLNKVQLIGYLGKDPELRKMDNGTSVTTFSVATNESYKDQSGKLIERTEWHRCVAWSKLAELLNEYLHKGSKVYVEGKLQTRSWDDKDGTKRYSTEIIVSEFVFLDSKDKTEKSEQPEAPAKQKDEDLPF